MGFDGILVPDWAKPYVGWVVGMDWPEGDETGCFRLADACVAAAYELVEGTGAERPWSADKVGADWDGEAHLAFSQHVSQVTGGKVADLVARLINTAVALNNVGVQIQYAKYMIEATVWLLIIQLAYLLAAAMSSGGATLALIPARMQLARLTVRQIAQQALRNIAIFAGIVAGMDAGIQLLQMAQGRRDELDLRQIGISAVSGGAMGGLMGVLTGGLSRLSTPMLRAGLTRAEMTTAEKLLAAARSSLYGQAAQYALTGGITTAGVMLAEGNFSWEMLAKGITSSALGADGQHLTTTLPRPHGSPAADGPPAGSTRAGEGPSPDGTAGPRGDATTPARPDAPVRTDSGTPTGRDTQPASSSGARTDSGTTLSQAASSAEPAQGTPRPGTAAPEGGGRPSPDAQPRAADPAVTPIRGAEPVRNAEPVRGTDPNRGTEPVRGTDQNRGTEPVRGTDQNRGTEPDRGSRGTGTEPQRPASRAAADPPRSPDSATRPSPEADPTTPRPTADDNRAPAPPADNQAPSRLERLLNHDGVPDLTDRGTTTESAAALTDSAPPPDAAPPPAHADTPPARSRVPFDFERFFNDPRWHAETVRFEQRLGAYYFNNPQTLDAARGALTKLRDALMALTPRQPGERPADFVRRVESVFFRDDVPDSAGQVGTGVTFNDLIRHGNLRELMTAFYNGAYFNYGNPHTLSHRLIHVLDGRRWEDALSAGMNLDELRRVRQQLDESLNRPILERLERIAPGSRFARDPFGTGNVVMLSERGFRDLAEVIQSQWSRQDRTPAEQEALITTPGHYERLGTPLGRFERAFVESVTDGPLRPDTPLPWREGVTAHETTSSRWARRVIDDGFLVIDGVSATTTRMLTAAKLLDLSPAMTERFLGSLMGWMLPSLDHSLFEIARGAQIADVGGMRLDPGSRPNVVDFYRNLPGLDLATLRREILPDGMFPHEARYWTNATDAAGFSETQHPRVRQITEQMWPQLESGRVTDPQLRQWLDRNGIDPADPAAVQALADRLSKPHLTALTVYTRHSHYLINNVIRTQLWTGGVSESLVHRHMSVKADQLIQNYLDNLAADQKALPLPLALRPLLHAGEGHLDSRSPLRPLAEAYIDAARRAEEARQQVEEHKTAGRSAEARQAGQDLRQARADQRAAMSEIKERTAPVSELLFDEMRWHADMVHDALMQLPARGSPEAPAQAYRGDWITPIGSPIYGSKLVPYGRAREVLSMSNLMEVAIRFMAENPASDRKVLVVYQLTGQQARDISIFSSFPEDQESVFPPGSRMRRVDDPELAARIHAEAERLAADMVRRGVIPEAPHDYRIIVMEEDPRDH